MKTNFKNTVLTAAVALSSVFGMNDKALADVDTRDTREPIDTLFMNNKEQIVDYSLNMRNLAKGLKSKDVDANGFYVTINGRDHDLDRDVTGMYPGQDKIYVQRNGSEWEIEYGVNSGVREVSGEKRMQFDEGSPFSEYEIKYYDALLSSSDDKLEEVENDKKPAIEDYKNGYVSVRTNDDHFAVVDLVRHRVYHYDDGAEDPRDVKMVQTTSASEGTGSSRYNKGDDFFTSQLDHAFYSEVYNKFYESVSHGHTDIMDLVEQRETFGYSVIKEDAFEKLRQVPALDLKHYDHVYDAFQVEKAEQDMVFFEDNKAALTVQELTEDLTAEMDNHISQVKEDLTELKNNMHKKGFLGGIFKNWGPSQ